MVLISGHDALLVLAPPQDLLFRCCHRPLSPRRTTRVHGSEKLPQPRPSLESAPGTLKMKEDLLPLSHIRVA